MEGGYDGCGGWLGALLPKINMTDYPDADATSTAAMSAIFEAFFIPQRTTFLLHFHFNVNH